MERSFRNPRADFALEQCRRKIPVFIERGPKFPERPTAGGMHASFRADGIQSLWNLTDGDPEKPALVPHVYLQNKPNSAPQFPPVQCFATAQPNAGGIRPADSGDFIIPLFREMMGGAFFEVLRGRDSFRAGAGDSGHFPSRLAPRRKIPE